MNHKRTCKTCGKTKPVRVAFVGNNPNCKKCHRKVVQGKKPRRAKNVFTKGTKNTVLKRAEGKCEHCGAKSRLELHHLKPVCLHPELSNSVSNLKALCPSCHKREHNKPGNTHYELAAKANRLRREGRL